MHPCRHPKGGGGGGGGGGELLLEEGAEQKERKKKWGEGEGRSSFMYASIAVVVDDDLGFNEINGRHPQRWSLVIF